MTVQVPIRELALSRFATGTLIGLAVSRWYDVPQRSAEPAASRAAGFAAASPEDWAKLPGARTVERADIAPGLDPSIYAYIRWSIHADLFRIPLH